ncbi:MAG TPA: LacI family DNA-binding transcriptional regulator [Mycobacteriales bacterium]|nr:LacI family DNA-binding transcriptional regulator [Mycobacteriales bacterium]
MYASLKDVAARAEVSFQTVSKVLGGRPVTVSDATRQRIWAAAEELGYVPNAVARGLVSKSTYTIGILTDDLEDWVLSQFVVAAEREARAHGHAVLIGAALPESTDARAYLQQLLERRVDGIITAAPSHEEDTEIAELLRGRVPVVSIHHVPGGGVPVIGSSHSEAGRMAAEHLIGLDHREIGMITGPPSRRVVTTRSTAFRRTLTAAGVSLPPRRIVAAGWDSAAGYDAATQLLAAEPDLTAIYAHSDLMAVGVLAALRDRGRRVPDDCAVIGCDDIPFAAHLNPPLSTVHVPFRETGRQAMALLIDRIRGADVERKVTLPLHLVVRESTIGRGDSP